MANKDILIDYAFYNFVCIKKKRIQFICLLFFFFNFFNIYIAVLGSQAFQIFNVGLPVFCKYFFQRFAICRLHLILLGVLISEDVEADLTWKELIARFFENAEKKRKNVHQQQVSRHDSSDEEASQGSAQAHAGRGDLFADDVRAVESG